MRFKKQNRIYQSGVSIIILTHNGAYYLNRLFSSFFMNNTHHPVEIIIIDHGSTDETDKVIEKFSDDAFIMHVRYDQNYSYSVSNNRAAKMAFYPNLLFLNNDIIYTADALPQAVQRIKDPRVGAVGIRLDDEPSRLPDQKPQGVQHAGIIFKWDHKKGDYRHFHVRYKTLDEAKEARSGFFPAITAAFFLCRKADFDSLGGFCEQYDYGKEDIDFCLRLQTTMGKKCYCMNDISLQHVEGATRKKAGQEARKKRMVQNEAVFKCRMGKLLMTLMQAGSSSLSDAPSVDLIPNNGKTKPALRVLFVLPAIMDSNDGYQVERIILGLQPLGVECQVAVPRIDAAGKEASGGSYKVLPYSSILQEGLSYSDGGDPDLIHAWTPREKVRRFVESLKKRYSCPVVIHLEDNEEYLLETSKGFSFQELAAMPIKKLDMIVPQDRYHPIRGKEWLESVEAITMIIDTLEIFNYGNLKSISLLPSADESLFYPRPINYDLRRRLNIPDDQIVLVYTGNVHSGNMAEVLELYRAVNTLNEKGLHTILLRTGNDCRDFSDLINREMGAVKKYLIQLGWVDRQELPDIMAAANMFVQPGKSGQFNDYRIPCKLIEYFALGRPVVLPRTNLGLMVEHEKEAYVVDEANGEAIADAVSEISADEKLYRALSVNAVEFYLDRLTDTSIFERFNDFYINMLNTHVDASKLASGLPSYKKETYLKPFSQQPVFHIVTPCLNSSETIDQTILSIVSQAGDFSIRYHVQDGGSVDGTVDKLKRWSAVLSQRNICVNCRAVIFTWSSEPDSCMYDAIGKGFNIVNASSRDFMTWLNSDDILLPGALSALSRIIADHPEIQWIGGPQYVIDDNGNLVLERQVPTPTKVIQKGLCDGKHWYMLQQEGTFFTKLLWFKSRHALRGFKLAGDWSLWRQFACHAEYYQLSKPLAAFRKREGQVSEVNKEQYMAEIEAALPFEGRNEAFQNFCKEKGQCGNLVKYNETTGINSLEKEYESVRKMFELFREKSRAGGWPIKRKHRDVESLIKAARKASKSQD